MASKSHIASYLPIEDVSIPVNDDAHYFPFDHHLASTKLLYPEGWDNHTVTDYGLYTGTNLCATLRKGEGKYGGAVAIEEGTTNLHTDPFNVSRMSFNSTNLTREIYETDTPFGVRQVARYSGLGGSNYIAWSPTISLDTQRPVTVSLWLRPLSGTLTTPRIYLGASYHTADTTYTGLNQWSRIVKTLQPGQFTSGVVMHFYKGSDGPVEVCAVQIEQKPFPTSFVDGSRNDGRLGYSNIINSTKGTFCAWHYLTNVGTAGGHIDGDQYLIANGVGWNMEGHFAVKSGNWTGIQMRSSSPSSHTKTFPPEKRLPNTWQHWAFVYDTNDGTADVYIDGELVTDGKKISSMIGVKINGTLWLSGHNGNIRYGASGLRDDIAVFQRVLSQEEIRAIYHSQRPLYDPNRIDHIVG
jgi:hypothetical protein